MTPTAHLTTRKRATMARMSEMRTLGINSPHTSVPLRLFMYKTYVRPVLLYGVETQSLNKEQTRELQVFESTIIKRLVGISKYCRSSHLIYASTLDRIEERVASLKLGLIGRLATNRDTRSTTIAIQQAYESTRSKKLHRLSVLAEVNTLTQSNTTDMSQLATASWRTRKEIERALKEKQGSQDVTCIREVLEDRSISDHTRADRLSLALQAG